MFMENFIEPELSFMELQYEEIITQSVNTGDGWPTEPVTNNGDETKKEDQWPNF